jgi:hypothetical protein
VQSFELCVHELNQTPSTNALGAPHYAWLAAAISFTMELVDNDTCVTLDVL